MKLSRIIPEERGSKNLQDRYVCACGMQSGMRWLLPVEGIGNRIAGWKGAGAWQEAEKGNYHLGCQRCGRVMRATRPYEVVDQRDPQEIWPGYVRLAQWY